ncbi:MAG: hypothetical protein HC838_02450 [Spirulinaceae cyanobacterium RM2_2_10]|nr:hypothetical protein [Spirulinaceae cyanobacterium RM2_2_10]
MTDFWGVELLAVASQDAGLGLGDAIWGALRLDVEIFQRVEEFAPDRRLGILVTLLAGLSRGIATAFILFINRVQPLRFVLSLLLEAIFFVAGFIFWAVSTGLVARFGFGVSLPVDLVTRALGLAHAPQLFSLLGALPYLGVPWLTLLSLWTALAFVTGMRAIAGLDVWGAFWCMVLGWLVLQVLQRTAGQPVMNFGRWLRDYVAGVALVSNRQRLQELLQSGQEHQGGDRRE